jgi:hypothetical protein
VKALIIILALVGVTFIGLLVYGGNRDERPKRSCEQLPPSFNSKDGPSEDEMEDWCPPDVAKSFTRATRGLQARFTKGLGIDPVELKTSPTIDGKFLVPASDKKARGAKLTLVQGDWAIAGAGDDQICLCRPGAAIPNQLFDSKCDDEWKDDHRAPKSSKPGICQPHDDHGILPFQDKGGLLEVLRGAPATVKVE